MKLFAGDMWSITNFGDPNERYQKFLARGQSSFKRFLEGVLLYDQVIVPTQDFLSLTILVGVLGENAVLELLDAGILRFSRVRGGFAYIGNGGGIQPYKIRHQSGKQLAFGAPLDEAVAWALAGLIERPQAERLPALVAENSTEIDSDEIFAEVKHETYLDILNSAELREQFAVQNSNMDRLIGVGPKDVRIYGGPDGNWKGDEIDVVMALAATNLELRLKQSSGCEDATSASPVGQILKAKALRTVGRDAAESFLELRTIADVPDLGQAILEKRVSVADIVKLAQTRAGQQFRPWFHEHCRSDPVTTGREYVRLLNVVPPVQSFKGRGIRFIATTAAGLLPGVGQIASVVDSFFIERWLRGTSPKFFIDALTKLIPCEKPGV